MSTPGVGPLTDLRVIELDAKLEEYLAHRAWREAKVLEAVVEDVRRRRSSSLRSRPAWSPKAAPLASTTSCFLCSKKRPRSGPSLTTATGSTSADTMITNVLLKSLPNTVKRSYDFILVFRDLPL